MLDGTSASTTLGGFIPEIEDIFEEANK